MYTILLVDDEDEVRRSIRDLTPWSEYGFGVIGEASNGMEALDFVEETMPDVIITDIRMPYLDGIGFIEEVRRSRSSSVEVIILSGYDEFTFAQTAMRLDVAEYVLKPVSVASMRDVLKRSRARLDEDRAKVSDKEKLDAFYREAIEVYKEKFLVSLIAPTRRQDAAAIAARAEEYGVPLEGRMFAVSVIDAPSQPLSTVAVEEIIDEAEAESVCPCPYAAFGYGLYFVGCHATSFGAAADEEFVAVIDVLLHDGAFAFRNGTGDEAEVGVLGRFHAVEAYSYLVKQTFGAGEHSKYAY